MPQKTFTELSQFELDPESIRLLSRRFCESNDVVILGVVDRRSTDPISLGMRDVNKRSVIFQVEEVLSRSVTPVQLNAYEIRKAIEEGFDDIMELEHVVSLQSGRTQGQSVPALLDHILAEAVRRRASDIHIETYLNDVDLRYRIDGILQQQFTELSPDNVNEVISRLKVMANMDIAERRKPQDGRISMLFADGDETRRVDFRLSVVPAMKGEDAVLRVLDAEVGLLGIEELGMHASQQRIMLDLLANPEGMILVTGPTGSGKTTTLYSALSHIGSSARKIITAEDPIEYYLPKINQKQVSEIMPFQVLLRALLRQDPDVMLFGEIRDLTTAQTAVAAATTGHVVLGTLHTSDALGAVTRLRGLELDDADIASSVLAVVAQRLVRRINPRHRVAVTPTEEERARFGPLIHQMPLYGVHPDAGLDGYEGRVGVFELLVIDEEMQDLIDSGAHKPALRLAARERGFRTMLDDGLEKVRAGLTTLDELTRIIPYREIALSRDEAGRS